MATTLHVQILRRSKLSDVRIGKILGVPRETVNRWRHKKQAISYTNAEKIDRLSKQLAKRK